MRGKKLKLSSTQSTGKENRLEGKKRDATSQRVNLLVYEKE